VIVYPRIIAHRCGGALAPENTLIGLEAAARLGCRAVEFDVMLTSDREPILIHDETLERTTRCTGRVADQTLAQIRACAPEVPTLAEAIGACRRLGLWANVELKPAIGHEEETGAIVGAWLAVHWAGNGVVSSFSAKSALAARRFLPDAAFAILFEALPGDWQAQCASLGAAAVHLDADRVDAATATCLRESGLAWACYTVNDRANAKRLFELGCAAVFSDRPDLWQPAEM
jgi:glycerophosphoryl diester phosphodiesterase